MVVLILGYALLQEGLLLTEKQCTYVGNNKYQVIFPLCIRRDLMGRKCSGHRRTVYSVIKYSLVSHTINLFGSFAQKESSTSRRA